MLKIMVHFFVFFCFYQNVILSACFLSNLFWEFFWKKYFLEFFRIFCQMFQNYNKKYLGNFFNQNFILSVYF